MTAKPYRSHDEATVESFARDPAYAAEYLNAVLEDDDEAELLVALNRLTKAFGGVTTVAAQVERFPGQDQNNSVGFGVSVPLFLNYTYDGEIRRAEANALASRDLLDRSRAVAVNEARRAWSDLAAARDRVLRFDGSLLREATRAADAAEFAYRNGALGVIDLLDARRVLYATRVESVAAHADLARAIAAWNAVTQPRESTK